MITETTQYPAWKEIFAVLSEYEYGTEITHNDMEKICKISRSITPALYYGQIRKAMKNLLLEKNKLLVNLYNKGYQIVKPEQHRLESRKSLIQGRRKIKQSCKKILHSPQHLLSDRENRMNTDMLSKLGSLTQHCGSVLAKTREYELEKRADVPKLFDAKGN